MTRTYKGCDYTIVYNGEIYNTPELTTELKALGVTPQTYCDTEIVLYCYILFGEKCAEKLNGIFAFAVLDSAKNQLCLVRDRFGIKPLFYAFDGETPLQRTPLNTRGIGKISTRACFSLKAMTTTPSIWQTGSIQTTMC